MNGWRHEKTIDLIRDQISGALMHVAHLDAKANEWIVHVLRDGVEADLSGYRAKALFIRSDGATVSTDAVIDGSTVSAILPQNAYNVRGRETGALTLYDDYDQIITIDVLTLEIDKTATDVIAPDENLIFVGWEDLETEAKTLVGAINEIARSLSRKQDELISGENIKTVNGESILGSGNIVTGSEVTSVNGKKGAVTLTASDVDALPSNTRIPSKTSDLENDSEFANVDQIPKKTSDLENDDRFITENDVPVKSVNGKTGNVDLTPADLGIGTVFTLKGSVDTVADLPDSGNEIGDVYYVIAESVGYIWLNDGSGDRWEQLGIAIDLSEYAKESDLEETNEDVTQLNKALAQLETDTKDAFVKLDNRVDSMIKTDGVVDDDTVISINPDVDELELLTKSETIDLIARGGTVTNNTLLSINDNAKDIEVLTTDDIDSIKRAWEYRQYSTKSNPPYFIVHLDCARKYFSVQNIKRIIDTMRDSGYNQLELHFSETEGYRFALPDMVIATSNNTYNLNSCLGGRENPTKFYTIDDMDEIIGYARDNKVEVVPCFECPAHMGWILSKYPSLQKQAITLNYEDDEAVEFCGKVVEEYCKYFASRGCHYFNLGTDEVVPRLDVLYATEAFSKLVKFVNKMIDIVEYNGMIARVFNDIVCYQHDYRFRIKPSAEVLLWEYRAIADGRAIDMFESGYTIINCWSRYYWVLGGTDNCTPERVKDRDILFLKDRRCIGWQFSIWCDNPTAVQSGDEGNGVTSAVLPVIASAKDYISQYKEIERSV